MGFWVNDVGRYEWVKINYFTFVAKAFAILFMSHTPLIRTLFKGFSPRSWFSWLMVWAVVSSCTRDSGINNNNPYIPIVNFSYTINLSLPLYSGLSYPGNTSVITYPGVGYYGVVVLNTGSGYVAYELACPNQSISSCSRLTINGINAVCSCDQASYNLYTGQAQGKTYPLKAYRVSPIEGGLIISN